MSMLVIAANPPFNRGIDLERPGIEASGAEVEVVQVGGDDELIRVAREADGLLPGMAAVTRKVIDGLERCKVIAAGGIGVDKIDVAAATEKGIVVTNIPDVFTEEVADQAFALLLAVNRQVVECDRRMRAGEWSAIRPSLRPVPKIPGKTLGLVAFGNIPRAVARRAHGFQLRVIAFDPFVSAEAMREHGVEKVELDELFSQADFVSCHLPLNDRTHHLVGARQFALMKEHAIFISTGRGAVVDERALIEGLRAGKPTAAGLDVFEQEPIAKDNPLLTMDNVVVTPHLASMSIESDIARRIRAGEEIGAVLSGRRPRNVVNREVLDRLSLR
jgi:D-3-phosphoglycerate dehydrogenase